MECDLEYNEIVYQVRGHRQLSDEDAELMLADIIRDLDAEENWETSSRRQVYQDNAACPARWGSSCHPDMRQNVLITTSKRFSFLGGCIHVKSRAHLYEDRFTDC